MIEVAQVDVFHGATRHPDAWTSGQSARTRRKRWGMWLDYYAENITRFQPSAKCYWLEFWRP